MDNEIMVSVYCLAYNHEKYIKDALEGFVNQKTNFKYEVLVHDDASTDGTQEIIKQYAEKYPDVIKPILQKENQYSKGVKISQTHIFPKLKGKYVALCEGDDYWIDENKLQKQFDFMENNKDFSACAHNTLFKELKTGKSYVKYDTNDKEITIPEIIDYGWQYHINSVFYRKELVYNRPDFVTAIKGVGDVPLIMYLGFSGRVMRFGEVMSVYRYGTVGSWSERVKSNREEHLTFRKQSINMFKLANEYSGYKYNDEFTKRITRIEYEIAKTENDYKKIKNIK